MATDISEVYSAEALVGYYNAMKGGGDVHYSFLGEQFFPTLKHKGFVSIS